MTRTYRPFLLAAALPLLLPAAALHAQDGFLFRSPQVQLTLRAGPSMPAASGPIFDFMTTELTLDRSDFRAAGVSGEIALLLGERWDVAGAIGAAESSRASEYRDFIGSDGLPIEQTTRLRMVPASATLRFYPLARGRSISSLSWIPTRTTPYVGAGGGVTWYTLEQSGEFIEHATGDIFQNSYTSSDNAFTIHALAGATHWFTPRVGLNAEARYTRGTADLTGSYSQYRNIDVSGVQASVGLSLRW